MQGGQAGGEAGGVAVLAAAFSAFLSSCLFLPASPSPAHACLTTVLPTEEPAPKGSVCSN